MPSALAGVLGSAGCARYGDRFDRRPRQIGALFAGLSGLPRSVPPFADPILLRANTEIAMAFGVLGPPLVAAYVVPPLPQLLGTPVAWQGATIGGSVWQVSNAVTDAQW
jgi:hypothetical protein